MKVTEAVQVMRMLATVFPRQPWEKRPEFSPPPSAESLSEYEGLGGFRLPADMREYFAEVDSVVALSIGYWIGGVELLSRSMRRGDFPTSVGNLPVLAIATDGGGNAFLMDETNQVWRWNHEDGSAAPVASSFTSFLAGVVEDFRAYCESP